MAAKIAPRLCRTNPATGENCSWHHGFWQYLRLMELAVTPANQADFYHRALRSVMVGSAAPRVLISGTTDYSMLAHVLATYRERSLEPAVTVVDICETSLFLNRWYAERVSAGVECHRSDILDCAPGVPFDAVCADSFLGQFSPEGRVWLLEKWRELLRPGGRAITVTRVRATDSAAQIGFSPVQAEALRAAIMRCAASAPAWLPAEPAEILHAAEIYLDRQRTWPVRSREELRRLFGTCGFRVDELSDTPPAAVAGPRTKVPASPGSGEQVRIIATRL